MSLLLKGYDDLIKYLGRAVMRATTDEFIAPYLQTAQDDVLARAIGDEFIAELAAQYEANQLTPANEKVLPRVQKAVAWFGYLAYLPFSIGQDGDNGLQEMGTETTNPVRMGILDKRQRESEKNAVTALESLLVFLELNAEQYPTYNTSAAAIEMRSMLVPSATVMSAYLPQIAGNFRLFLNLKPYLALAERDFVLPRIGQAQFDRFKEGLVAGDLSADEKALLDSIRRALSHTAYRDALPQLQFTVLSTGQIRVLSDFDGIYSSKVPDKSAMKCLISGAETDAKKWQNALRAHLSKHIEKFPLYKAAMAAKEPSPNKLPDNSNYHSVFRLK